MASWNQPSSTLSNATLLLESHEPILKQALPIAEGTYLFALETKYDKDHEVTSKAIAADLQASLKSLFFLHLDYEQFLSEDLKYDAGRRSIAERVTCSFMDSLKTTRIISEQHKLFIASCICRDFDTYELNCALVIVDKKEDSVVEFFTEAISRQ